MCSGNLYRLGKETAQNNANKQNIYTVQANSLPKPMGLTTFQIAVEMHSAHFRVIGTSHIRCLMTTNPGTPDQRAVVVNSLLCFINNFRRHVRLDTFICTYFSESAQQMAYNLLVELLSDVKVHNCAKSPQEDKTTNKVELILSSFDQLIATTHAPVFAAADLTLMPFVLMDIPTEDNENRLVLQELRQLRFLMQDFFSQSTHGGIRQNCEPHSCKHLLDAKSIVRSDASTRSSPPPASCLLPQKRPARDSPVTPPLSSATSTVFPTPSSPAPSISSNGNSLPNLASTPTMGSLESLMIMARQSPTTFTSANSSPTKKKSCHSGAGNRLDQAVRKLTDRLEARGQDNTGREYQEHSNDSTMSASNIDSHQENGARDQCFVVTNGHADGTLNNSGENEPHDLTTKNSKTAILNGFQSMASQNALGFGFVQMLAECARRPSSPAASQVGAQSTAEGVNRNQRSNSSSTANGHLSEEGVSEDDDQSLADSKQNCTKDSSPSNDDDGVDKPFSCPHVNCQKRFTNKFLLKKHQFIHTGLRPHSCPYCTKRFNRKDNLLRHKKTHLANALLCNGDGGRKRHNMLYGVSEEMAALDMSLNGKSQPALKKKRKRTSEKGREMDTSLDSENEICKPDEQMEDDCATFV
ncbi:putative zinc finger protein [Ditylenchus destructor]|uniref:Zinc finger protein n=1 Tax=Ditylenchus destructor TaxID=166010 RepID=A0AAD4RBS2_9BILA|nr:putative zinc finger protein [Ditylenchus destructor]